ncbi:MAG: DUF92 domain-containing protein [Methanomassiliicoccaceae archaeon]|nr:DUF92 domain-containing protein [Methanomassiliicoccaceae archaeon]
MDLLTIIFLAGLLSILAQYLGLLTFDGAVASLGIGLVIGFFGSVDWLLILIIFTGLGFAATLVGLAKKRAKGHQEGSYGERMYKNILAVGIAPCVFAVLCYFTADEHYTLLSIAYISSITVAAADTIASEVGVKDKKVWLITSFKRVEPGTDGGISVMGTGLALLAAIVVAAIGWYFIFDKPWDMMFLIPVTAGMVGCLMDSVFGATLERRGYLSKYTNNASTAMIGSIFAMAVYTFMF